MRPIDLTRVVQGLGCQHGEQFGILSGSFALLFLAFLVVYPIVARTRASRVWALLVFSLYVYYKATGAVVGLLVASARVDFGIGRFLAHDDRPFVRRTAAWVGIGLNLAVLACFRYTRAWRV